MKEKEPSGFIIWVFVFTITFVIVELVYERFGVKDRFFPIVTDAIISSLWIIWLSNRKDK